MSAAAWEPKWVRVEGNAHQRCGRCHNAVGVTWRWYATPSRSTHCYCEPCVAELLSEDSNEAKLVRALLAG